jgi:hypothetical protein
MGWTLLWQFIPYASTNQWDGNPKTLIHGDKRNADNSEGYIVNDILENVANLKYFGTTVDAYYRSVQSPLYSPMPPISANVKIYKTIILHVLYVVVKLSHQEGV